MQSILNLVTTAGAAMRVARGGRGHILTIYDSIEEKKCVLDLKVANREFAAVAEAADVPVQYRILDGKEGKMAVCDNVVARGKLLNLTVIAGAGEFGRPFNSAAQVKDLLENAASNSFYLEYDDLLSQPMKNLIITDISARETASGNKGTHMMIQLCLKQVLPFTLESPFPPKATSVRGVSGDLALGILEGSSIVRAINSPKASPDVQFARGQVEIPELGLADSQFNFYEISLSFNFSNYYKFATNFYLNRLFLGFIFNYIEQQNRYELSIFSDNNLIYQGIARFFEPVPGFLGYNLEAPWGLRPAGKFVFMPAVSTHPKAQANITKEDFTNLNFRLFFIEPI